MLGDKIFQHLAPVIHSPPQVVGFTVDFDKDFVQVPLSLWPGTHPFGSVSSDFRRKHGTEPVPPKPDSFVANIDTTFM